MRVDECNRLRDDWSRHRADCCCATARTCPATKPRNWTLLDANRALPTVNLLKDDLKQLWDLAAKHGPKVVRRMEATRPGERTGTAQGSCATAGTVLLGILYHCPRPLGTTMVEGIKQRSGRNAEEPEFKAKANGIKTRSTTPVGHAVRLGGSART
ncbi:MAG: hypothetical protein M3Q42_01660 [Pseudomonadota bacterium]|nr:hypothetical protein [Pseudomonadota bacterium]